MQYKYPILQIVPARARKILSRVKDLIWETSVNPEVELSASKGGSLAEAGGYSYTPVTPGDYFGPTEWNHRWFRLNIPAAVKGETGRRYLYWNVQGESTVYIDGKVWCGLDIAHPRCPLPDKGAELYVECGLYQTGIWTKGMDDELSPVDRYGLRFHRAVLQLKNETAWSVFHDWEVLIKLMDYHLVKEGIGLLDKGRKEPLEVCSPFLRRLIRRLDEAADLLDREGLGAFAMACRDIFGEFPAEQWGLDLAVVGNSHLDLVWMWPAGITWKKAVHTLSSMIRLADKYPEMVFTMSQPPLMEHMKEFAPDLYESVRDKIKSGQWEATGVMEVEADTLLPCGEGLVRSILTGKKSFREYYGTEGEALWIPDVFGYSQCIPQICALTEIPYFFTTKMTWSEINRFPHNSFRWESPDGSSVLSHLANCGYDYSLTVEQAIDNGNMYRQSDVHNEMLIAFGYGDGGGGVTEAQCERIRRLENLATVPRAHWSKTGDFFHRLEEKSDKLPVYRGEMYLEYHRGTYTTQALFKKSFRTLEKALQIYEAVCVLTGTPAEADDEWKGLLFSQFHDAVPGSSIARVYEEMIPELNNMIQRLESKTLSLLSGDADDRLTWFNPHGTAVKRVVEVPEKLWKQVNPLKSPSQSADGNCLVYLSFNGCSIGGEDDQIPAEPISIGERKLGNGFFTVEFDEKGQLAAFIPRGEKSVLTGACGFSLHEDHPVNYDAWDIDRNACWLKKTIGLDSRPELIEKGPLRARFRTGADLTERSHVTVDYIVEADNPALMIEMDLDWNDREKLLRFEVPTLFRGRNALYGGPFGTVTRSGQVSDLSDAAQWEVPGSRWMAAVDDSGRGLALVSEAKYGFSCIDGTAGISLVRSPRTPDREEVIFTDQGRHRIRFALTSFDRSGNGPSPATLADVLYTDPVLCSGAPVQAPFRFEGPANLTVSWLKPSEKDRGYEIRLHETAGGSGEFSLHFRDVPGEIYAADLEGRKLSGPSEIDETAFRFTFRPHQILTILCS